MGNAVKEIYYGIDNGVIQMLFDCRLQLACLGITVYITWEYISSRHLKTDFRKIYISMLLTADVYYIFDMLTYYMVNHMADYELWKVDLVHRFFYAAMDFLISETFCYAAVLLKDVRKTGTGARYLMALPSVLCLMGSVFLPIRYDESIYTLYSKGPATVAVAACAGFYLILLIIMVCRYRSPKVRKKLHAVMFSMCIMVAIAVYQLFVPYMLVTSAAAVMLILTVYMSLEDAKEYADDVTRGFNRSGFREMLDYEFGHGESFTVFSVIIGNWTELTDMKCGISPEKALSFTGRLSEMLGSSTYRSRHNSVSYIIRDEKPVSDQQKIQKVIDGCFDSGANRIAPKVTFNVIHCPDEAADSSRVLEKIYSMALSVYRETVYFDEVTGCLNRNSYENDLPGIRNRVNESGKATCIMIDINDLKKTNDTYGHRFGDELIRETAELIRKQFSGTADVYRIGGDEFLLISLNADTEDITLKLRQMEADRKAVVLSDGEGISFALGVAHFCEEDKSIDDTIKRADAIMYANKQRSGKMRE